MNIPTFALEIVVGLVIGGVIGCIVAIQSKVKGSKCRKCGKSGDMAIEYDTDGVCRHCLTAILKVQGILKE
jgi:hypothetical protein